MKRMGALGLMFLAVGAILSFAVADNVEGANLVTIGYILMAVGAVGVITALAKGTFGIRSHTERHVSDDGRTVVEDRHTSQV